MHVASARGGTGGDCYDFAWQASAAQKEREDVEEERRSLRNAAHSHQLLLMQNGNSGRTQVFHA